MLTVEQIRTALADRNLRSVAEASGIHYNVIRRVAKAESKPSYATVKALSDYITRQPHVSVNERVARALAEYAYEHGADCKGLDKHDWAEAYWQEFSGQARVAIHVLENAQ